ncbi:transcriptional regulator [Anaerobacillus isosaccharinicus]|uniref:Transcriptional regulator n=1 Tax=Anaerobacillus isosaccharinicus TaxID=1532552 RepID=A0A1S2L928_9BACI|nr:helix-turn-helix transcriptional regulator [Anaerobacillus isosaccharinicus]MBA5584595.1 helix-turn-helix transcriptional regulator [Anaerobacillus isosaccharinicus]QOY37026.1 helix-turn-helix transcriptional regulator [Anaerobacillus isosaccharinicus]
MFGLGKPRTKLGKWMDQRGIKGSWLSEKTNLNKCTISDLTSKGEHAPNQSTMKKILKALRQIDPNVKVDDFWDM